MPWERFGEANKNLCENDKVLEDSKKFIMIFLVKTNFIKHGLVLSTQCHGKDLLKQKKNLYENNKVVEWDDSTKIYHVFLARSSCQKSDDIDWNSEIDPELLFEIKSITDSEEKKKKKKMLMTWIG
ncbi:hypothetical protein CXB51_009538 [Gossypium anomalum]|uniref:Uncharacterized protein n=1 Tax=Gossypium anomalum TaxID=47600 RepID=A0A8J6D5L8_9ROSI|nr:hypothetical protein CXB51_009538 [Gossypium anomalum]